MRRAFVTGRGRRCLAALAVAVAVALGANGAMAIEEPDYRVVRTIDDVEIRDYAAYVAAEVTVAAPASDAAKQAFPILFAYLSGRNRGEHRLAMTAPVTQAAAPARASTAAPVTQAATADGHVVAFVLPKGTTLADAPVPLDPRVRLVEVPAARVAAIRYSGFWTDANDAEHLARLASVVAAAGLVPTGGPVYARYDAPFKPWFMRRNEIWLRLPLP